MKRLLVFFMVFCAISTVSFAQNWVGTWATAPQTVVKSFMPYNNCMTNRSVRQVVKVSIGGDVIRLKLSNIYSMQSVEIRSIYIAHAKDSFAIDAKTAQYFKFGNSYKTVIPAGKQIVSDALKFNLRNLERVAITINYTSAPEVPTVHMGSRTTSYIMKGVTNAHSNFEKAFRENHWYNISGIDVYTMNNNFRSLPKQYITTTREKTEYWLEPGQARIKFEAGRESIWQEFLKKPTADDQIKEEVTLTYSPTTGSYTASSTKRRSTETSTAILSGRSR